jgi:uncharacterized tellurite resistance protein B-like protein
MLRTLKDLFNAALAPPGPAAPQHSLQLATAVLLAEVMRADTATTPAERRSAMASLQRQFGLATDELERLLELAERAARDATDFHQFTSKLNQQLEMGDKLKIVEAMWQVAYADGQLAAHEKHVLWRVADLLHVPHGAYINAKMRAQAAASATPQSDAA